MREWLSHRRLDRLREAPEAGETLLEGITAVTIIGLVVVVMIGAITLSISLGSIRQAQVRSQTVGRSIYEATSADRIPASTAVSCSAYSSVNTVINNAANSGTNARTLTVTGFSSGNPPATMTPADYTLVYLDPASGSAVQRVSCADGTAYPSPFNAGNGDVAIGLEAKFKVTAVAANSLKTQWPTTFTVDVYQGTS